MKHINKIAIIGHFGGVEHFTDGQTVKTINLYKELSRHTDWKIIKVDTYYKNKKPIVLFIKLIVTLLTTKRVIILLSENGMKFLFPVLYFFISLRKTEVYHDVIGGNLAQYVSKYPQYEKYLSAFCVNWVETAMLKTELEKNGISNVAIVPNFRRVKITEEKELQSVYKFPYHFCTFSRVVKEKGIEDAIQAIEAINSEENRTLCCLDIYGPVDKAYKKRFDKIMENVSDCIRYCGEVAYQEAIPALKNYYGVLFPTYWDGESNAGTVTESFFAGVPVIATDWRCNKEMIRSGYNGMLYPSEYAKDLRDGILWLIRQENEILEIKKNCLKSAIEYLPEKHIKFMIKTIEGK